ncbi:NACHT domain-containing protein [Actinobacillus equuli]|uniref:NACHT domain-containing protein n=1 Tax=Actinobacillus equuli TaxID=718 RepID=UPI002441803F|nr:hypothetical protein [Actinobacillus equuli]WGE79634.1 hypothetical protein NYR83_01480 [Actinobacillus equuli subsp. equuli]
MNSKFYLSRILHTTNNQEFNESELLLVENKIIIVLAEPGAGKSYLLDSLAEQIGVTKNTANIFIHSNEEKCSFLVIDGFDELVKIGSSTVIKALIMAKNTSAEKIILSSRSSEWSEDYTHHCKELFGEKPLLVYLKPFDEKEQKDLFLHYYPQQNAEQFLEAAANIELTPLLPNPLFLQLFAKSYVENNQCFENRYSAFKLAIEGLAKENNTSHSHDRNILPASKKIELVEDIFTKLMLSGSEGVSLSDLSSDRFYPHIATLNSDINITQILSTQFFLPADGEEQHRPVHRIVAEYCAGNYLAKKLTSAANLLSLRKILSIIAPNNIVRDELRGLFAWMAVLSENQHIQDSLIDLDPYAILSNGDPALLLPSSKRKLLLKLKKLNQEDPYFRRSDRWRNFSVSGFFTDELLDELKSLLSLDNSDGDLQGLLLELLADSPIISKLSDELKSIVCNNNFKDKYIRRFAGKCLSKIKDYNHQEIWKYLIEARDNISLTIAADLMASSNNRFQLNDYIDFLRVCAELYPTDHRIERVIGERFFIKQFIQKLRLDLVIYLLNELSANLFCTCQEKYDCQCRVGISKIISMLLDRYFELYQEPWEPEQIWKWVKNLYFQNGVRKEDSLSVKILFENDTLRQAIIKIAFDNKFDHKAIHQTKFYNFGWHKHSGLNFQLQDLKYIIDLAFDTNNVELWSYFMVKHDFFSKEKSPNPLRQHMRMQALQKTEFLRVWYQNNIENEKDYRKNILRYNRKKRVRTYNKKQRNSRHKDIQYIQENRQLIESGKHWNALLVFSRTILQKPDKILEKFGDEQLVRNAMYNCLDYIEPDIPSLAKLAELRCKSKILNIEPILYVACLEILKRNSSLHSVSVNTLVALRAGFSTYWAGMNSDDREILKQEVDKCLFSNPADAEKFLREYIEPQLACVECKNTLIDWLARDETFKFLQNTLPLEWLKKFPDMNFAAQKELLQLAIQFGNREELKEIVQQQCEKLLNIIPTEEDTELKYKRDFWFAHAFYLLDKDYELFWQELIKDDDSIFILEDHFGTFGDYSEWITLSSIKIELILNTFIKKWQKVHLPAMHGSDSPPSEKAYRFLSGLIYKLERNDEDNPVPVIDRLLQDARHTKFYTDLKSIRFNHLRKSAIQNFQVPTAEQIVHLLDKDEIISVENLRAVILEELQFYQDDLNGHDISTKSIFYHGKTVIQNRVDENTATQRIAERLRLRLENRQVGTMREGYMKDANRCDIVFSKLIDGKRKILPVEVKGQWHPQLYSAFDRQLDLLYAIHPDAEEQGIYLVLWFGANEKVANRKNHGINSAEELYLNIQKQIPEELKQRIDLFVLDLEISR